MAGVDEQEGASGCSCTLRSLSLSLFASKPDDRGCVENISSNVSSRLLEEMS